MSAYHITYYDLMCCPLCGRNGVRVLSLKALGCSDCVPQLGQSHSGPDSFAGDP